MSEWININNKMPKHGDSIKGMNFLGQKWEEIWDKDEPLGEIAFWTPLPEPPTKEK